VELHVAEAGNFTQPALNCSPLHLIAAGGHGGLGIEKGDALIAEALPHQ
jgi:hypothetical protein